MNTATKTATCNFCWAETDHPAICSHGYATCWTCDGTCPDCPNSDEVRLAL